MGIVTYSLSRSRERKYRPYPGIEGEEGPQPTGEGTRTPADPPDPDFIPEVDEHGEGSQGLKSVRPSTSEDYHARATNRPYPHISEEGPFQPLQCSRGVERRHSSYAVDRPHAESSDAPGVIGNSVPARGVHGDLPEDPACITDIFRLPIVSRIYDSGIDVYPGVMMIHTEGKVLPGRALNPGRKGKITSFSAKSRNNLLKHFGMMAVAPEVWQTLTFADDVMRGREIEERKEYSTYCLNRFEKYITKRFPKMGLTWRREWEKRKSGSLQGELCPHFHVMYYKESTTPEQYHRLIIILAEEWVRITGTQDPRALGVALHSKSWALLDNRTTAMKYVSKYMSKSLLVSNESIGRSWGIIGNIPMAEPERVRLTELEAVMLKRLLRRYAKRKRSLVRYLKGAWVNTFVLISGTTIERILRYIEDTITEEGRGLKEFSSPTKSESA